MRILFLAVFLVVTGSLMAWTPVPSADKAGAEVLTNELAQALIHIATMTDHLNVLADRVADMSIRIASLSDRLAVLSDHTTAMMDTAAVTVAAFQSVAGDARMMVTNANEFVNAARKGYAETHQTVMDILAQISKWVGAAIGIFYAFFSKKTLPEHAREIVDKCRGCNPSTPSP